MRSDDKKANNLHRRAVLIGTMLIPTNTAWADLYDDYISSKSKKHFVSFLARRGRDGSLTGHSYVAIGIELDNGLRIYERVLGYYPKSQNVLQQVKAVFSKTSGELKSTLPDIMWDVEFHVSIDEKSHKSVLKVVDEWIKSDPKYNLVASGGKNCSSFASEIATTIGLKVPTNPGTQLSIGKELGPRISMQKGPLLAG